MEMLTVIAIIAITVGLAAPAMMNAGANRRANEAQHAVVRIGARARSEAIAYGRAHVLSFRTTSSGRGGTFGTLELWRGRVDRCASNNWGALLVGSCNGNDDCVESLDMGRYAYPTHRVQLRMEGAANGTLCFQPNGEMFFAGPGGLWRDVPPAGADAVRFRLRRLSGGSPTGVDRFVIFPFGSTPRIQR